VENTDIDVKNVSFIAKKLFAAEGADWRKTVKIFSKKKNSKKL
jgi:hypothetical protein